MNEQLTINKHEINSTESIIIIIVSGYESSKGCKWEDLPLADYLFIMRRIKYAWPNYLGYQHGQYPWLKSYRKNAGCIVKSRGEDKQCSPLDYFYVALNIFGRYNMTEILEQGGILPSADKTYTSKELTDALVNRLKHRSFVLGCGEVEKDKTQILRAIKLLVNVTTMKPTSDMEVESCLKDYPIRYLPHLPRP